MLTLLLIVPRHPQRFDEVARLIVGRAGVADVGVGQDHGLVDVRRGRVREQDGADIAGATWLAIGALKEPGRGPPARGTMMVRECPPGRGPASRP